jgi:hypothetical protein
VNYYENSYFTFDGNDYDLVFENARDITTLLDYCIAQDEIAGKVIDFNYLGDYDSLMQDVTAALSSFIEKYELNGVISSFDYSEKEYGMVVRIMFEGVEEENARKTK